jgi:hypothetical protein
MTGIVLLALVLGILSSVVYLGLMAHNFLCVVTDRRADMAAGRTAEDDDIDDSGRFTLKSGGLGILSLAIITTMGLTPVAWSIVPFLGIATAVAISIAFIVDLRSRRASQAMALKAAS